MESKKPSSIAKSVKSVEKKNDIVKSSDSDSSISDLNVPLSSSIQPINTIPQSSPPDSGFERIMIEMMQSLQRSVDNNSKEIMDCKSEIAGSQTDFRANISILSGRIHDINNTISSRIDDIDT